MRWLCLVALFAALSVPAAAAAPCGDVHAIAYTPDKVPALAECLARAAHVRPITQSPATPRVVQIFLDMKGEGRLFVALRWNKDGTGLAHVEDRTYGGQPVAIALDVASARGIADEFEAYSAQTREGRVLRDAVDGGPYRLFCTIHNRIVVATNMSGSPAAVAGDGCVETWIEKVVGDVAEKLLAVRADCATLPRETPVANFDNGDFTRLAVCARMSGERTLALRVHADQTGLVAVDREWGAATIPDGLAGLVAPRVTLSLAGMAPVHGPVAVRDAMRALVADSKGFAVQFFHITARRGTVHVEGRYFDHSGYEHPRAAAFTQLWRTNALGEPRLIAWTIGAFQPIEE